MPTNDELRAAAEYINANIGLAVAYPHLARLITAASELACEILASHPADDGEPIDEAWLRETGLPEDEDTGNFHVTDYQQEVWLEMEGDSLWAVSRDGYLSELSKDITRGQLRRLIAALKGD